MARFATFNIRSIDDLRCPNYPSFTLWVEKKGFLFPDYYWKTLPGPFAEFTGSIHLSPSFESNYVVYSLCTLDFVAPGIFRYGWIQDVPTDMRIGAKGTGIVHYGGTKGREDGVVVSWRIDNAY